MQPVGDWTSRSFDDSKWQNVGSSLGNIKQGKSTALWLRRCFELDTAGDGLQTPYLKARWKGDFTIYINGVKVKNIKYGMDKTCGLYVNYTASATIKPGSNVIAVQAAQPGPDSFIDIGLIDWSSAK